MVKATHPVRKAVIPVAGLGTRFLPITKSIPKEMLPIIDKPIIQFAVEEALRAGITDILLVSSSRKAALEAYFDRDFGLEQMLLQRNDERTLSKVRGLSFLANLQFVHQQEPLGLGHAIFLARHYISNEPFAVLLPDEIFWSDTPPINALVELRHSLGGSVLGVVPVAETEVSRYGIIGATPVSERLHRVNRIVEKPRPENAPSRLAIAGRYVLDPNIFSALDELAPGFAGEVQLSDALADLATYSPLHAFVLEGRRFDTGEPNGYARAIAFFALQRGMLSPEEVSAVTQG